MSAYCSVHRYRMGNTTPVSEHFADRGTLSASSCGSRQAFLLAMEGGDIRGRGPFVKECGFPPLVLPVARRLWCINQEA